MGISSNPQAKPVVVSMADALFSKTQQSVLSLLFGQPHRSFYTNEIITLSGRGSGTVQRELSRLLGSGLVVMTQLGSQKHYQANQLSPIFDELCGIVLKTTALVEPIRSALAPLIDQIELAFVFGSVAKNLDTAASDVDLMILSDSLSYPDVYGELELVRSQLNRDINPTLYKREEFALRLGADNAFVSRVVSQPKLWIKGGESDLPAG